MIGNYTHCLDNRLMLLFSRDLEINGGRVENGETIRLVLPAGVDGYADAQIDDYGGRRRREYLWRQGTRLELRARFSGQMGEMVGTAGFGFWNAPFGDPTIRWPALPKAAWFFYASDRSNLPLASHGAGRGWFASTIDSTRAEALIMAPFAPIFIILNNSSRLRRILWPFIRNRLRMSYKELAIDMDGWHSYRLCWMEERCEFWVDETCFLRTDYSPYGPLGFVCWIDNQYLVATPSGRFRSGTLSLSTEQWLEISDLKLRAVNNC
jgi:hypothetical protein